MGFITVDARPRLFLERWVFGTPRRTRNSTTEFPCRKARSSTQAGREPFPSYIKISSASHSTRGCRMDLPVIGGTIRWSQNMGSLGDIGVLVGNRDPRWKSERTGPPPGQSRHRRPSTPRTAISNKVGESTLHTTPSICFPDIAGFSAPPFVSYDSFGLPSRQIFSHPCNIWCE